MSSFADDEDTVDEAIKLIATLPAELRRNLDLLKDMDGSCSFLMEETMRLQQGYIERVETKVGQLEMVETSDNEDGVGLRVLSSSSGTTAGTGTATATATATKVDCDNDNNNNTNDDGNTTTRSDVVIPTTEELLRYIEEPETLARIESVRNDSLQQAEEKIEIAKQSYKMIDNVYRKLDEMIANTNIYQQAVIQHTMMGGGHHNTNPAGTDFDPASFQHQYRHPLNNNNSSNHSNSATAAATALVTGGSGNASGSRGRGSAPKPNDLAAVTLPGAPDWILAKVVSYDSKSGIFTLSDEDVESTKKVFTLAKASVIVLDPKAMKHTIRTGDVVFAVYPDTTSFYQGTIAQPPRKSSSTSGSGGGGGGSAGMYVTVTFLDDEDAATGETHDKVVLLKHVMLPPY